MLWKGALYCTTRLLRAIYLYEYSLDPPLRDRSIKRTGLAKVAWRAKRKAGPPYSTIRHQRPFTRVPRAGPTSRPRRRRTPQASAHGAMCRRRLVDLVVNIKVHNLAVDLEAPISPRLCDHPDAPANQQREGQQ